MKIKLEDLIIYPEKSRGSFAFHALLLVNETTAGYAVNAGLGHPTFYMSRDAVGEELIRKAEAYCTTLPPITCPAEHFEGEQMKLEMNLEVFVDKILIDFLIENDFEAFRVSVKE